jgi:PRC-barrel domain
VSTIAEHAAPTLSWTDDFWLRHCEGFRVETLDRHLGYVEDIVCSDSTGAPLALRVRRSFGPGGVIAVPVDDVLELHQGGGSIVVRADENHGRHR